MNSIFHSGTYALESYEDSFLIILLQPYGLILMGTLASARMSVVALIFGPISIHLCANANIARYWLP